ncbi:tetratricopeptide repeat protein [Catenulispora yoronensis]
MDEIARLLYERGDHEGAQHWLQVAVQAGDRGAMTRLGRLHEEQDELALAERFYRMARERNDPAAMWATGRLARERGDEDLALRWFREAAEAGDQQARLDLTRWLMDRGEVQEAEHWACAAGEGSDPRGVFLAGTVLEELGKADDAVALYRKAADAGHFLAIGKMLAVSVERGDHAAADRYRALMSQTEEQCPEQQPAEESANHIGHGAQD